MEKLTSIYQVAFEGEFARLREFGPNDAEALVACSQDQAVARFMRWAQTLDEAHMLVETSSEDVQQIPRTRYHLAGVDLESGEVISIIRLSVTSRENGRVRISLGVRPDLRGQGWAPAIWADVAAFVFEQLRAHRLYALIHEENRASLRFAEKMDLTFEGKHREYFFEDSVWKDVLLYSTLRGVGGDAREPVGNRRRASLTNRAYFRFKPVLRVCAIRFRTLFARSTTSPWPRTSNSTL